ASKPIERRSSASHSAARATSFLKAGSVEMDGISRRPKSLSRLASNWLSRCSRTGSTSAIYVFLICSARGELYSILPIEGNAFKLISATAAIAHEKGAARPLVHCAKTFLYAALGGIGQETPVPCSPQ